MVVGGVVSVGSNGKGCTGCARRRQRNWANRSGKVVGNLDGGTFPNHVRADVKGNVFAVNKSRGAEDAKGDQWSHESRFAFDGPKYRASFGWNAFFENGYQRVPFSTEEGTYLACSVSPLLAPVRAALNGAGLPTGTACIAPNGTIPATNATVVIKIGRRRSRLA